MGNCLVMQEKVIKVMKPDGKVLEYKAPTKVHQVLSDFASHAISDTLPVVRHLRPDAEMIGGHLYYLLLLPLPPPAGEKINKAGQERGVVRIKVVISKQDLEMMLRKGVVSLDGMVSQLQKKQSMNQHDKFDVAGKRSREGWKPLLESIPEVD
ncbi:uncharacterized protein LOC130795522 [Actinidia eriantha]|uniref:uncharacterized protein LOC130795522 n=1 Tax=Actinidia eriantha TaxID=165200 RepID=UPI002584A96F|nr:uncharacterized protein LOC130795522 [Actinidia eriantha]